MTSSSASSSSSKWDRLPFWFFEARLLALTSSLRTGGGVPEHFGPQEKTPLGHHDFPGLYPTPNGDAVATQRPHLHGACDKLPLLVRCRNEDDLPLTDGLHGSAWDYHSALAARRRVEVDVDLPPAVDELSRHGRWPGVVATAPGG